MPECTKGPCENQAVLEIIVDDGPGATNLYRCDDHFPIDVGSLEQDIEKVRPPQQTLGEAVQEDG